MKRTLMAVIVALVTFATTAAGAETVYLKGGKILRGQVKSIGENALVMELEGLPGSRIEIPTDRISDYGLYELRRARIDTDSAKDHEELGDWAMDRSLLAFAMEEYSEAVKLGGGDGSPDLTKKLETASSKCGADKLRRSDQLVEEGRMAEAIRFLADIIENHPSCPAAATARERIAKLKEARAEERRTEKKPESDAETVEKALDTIRQLVAKGDRLRRLGYLESGSLGRAEDAFLGSIQAFERASELLDRAAKLPAARERAEDVSAWRKKLNRRLVDVYVDTGHNYIVKGNLVKANHYMGLALSIDPNDPNALALRQAIAVATAGDRWGRPR